MAEIIRYVDTDVTGGLGDGTSWANAYSSLATAEAAEEADLVTAGDSITFQCRASSGTADTNVNFVGWTTGTSNTITAIGEESTYMDTSKYRFTGVLTITEEYVTIKNIQFVIASTYGLRTSFTGVGAAILDGCVFDGGTYYMMYMTQGSQLGTTILVKNCLFANNAASSGIVYATNSLTEHYFYNNTYKSVKRTGRFGTTLLDNNRLYFKNNVFSNMLTNYCYNALTANDTYYDYNFSDKDFISDQIIGTHGGELETFTFASATDFALSSSDTGAKDKGVTLANVTEDVVGTARPQNSIYDVGFFEIVSGGGGGTTIPIVVNNLRIQGIL